MKKLLFLALIILSLSCTKESDFKVEIINIRYKVESNYPKIYFDHFNGVDIEKDTFAFSKRGACVITKGDQMYFKIKSKAKIKFYIYGSSSYSKLYEADSILIIKTIVVD